MAQSEQQRQRKLAKKQAKSREKHKLIARTQQSLASMAGKMQASSKGEIVYCGVSEAVAKSGLGYVLIVRQGTSRQVGIAMFLVDLACLGVKNVIATLQGPTEAKDLIDEMENERDMKPVAPGLARGLVEASVGYARSIGFEPHADYRKAAIIWGDIKAESIEGHYTFGRNGKPFYANGPYEDHARQQHILRTLERTVGLGNFHYMLGYSSVPNGMPEFFRRDNFFEDEDLEDVDEIDATDVRLLEEPHS